MPDSFNHWYIEHSGKNTVDAEVLRHVRRELFQEQWGILLDDEFVHAYEHGLVVDCADSVRRRFYPRILTYSADYPERYEPQFRARMQLTPVDFRMKVVGVRTRGDKVCPRCLISTKDVLQLGTSTDRETRSSTRRVDDTARRKKVDDARKLIYGKKAYAVKAAPVEELLKPASLTPAKVRKLSTMLSLRMHNLISVMQNLFSQRLSSLGFDIYDIPSVDVLHEVEIGTWKDLFVHLLRLLEAIDAGKLEVLNSRYDFCIPD